MVENLDHKQPDVLHEPFYASWSVVNDLKRRKFGDGIWNNNLPFSS